MTPTTDEEQPLILKTDALGRVRMPKDRREAIVDAFEQSGMSGQAFAAHAGLKYSTFAKWVQKRRRARGDYKVKNDAAGEATPITLFETVVESEQALVPQGALEVETTDGLKLRIGSSAEVTLAAELLQTLRGPRAC